MEKAATDIYTFENLRKRGYTYVDKTAILKELVDDSTAKKAIEQIQAKDCTDRFRPSGKPITLIGIAFSTKRRAVSGVKIARDA
jgi:hypothetical protein